MALAATFAGMGFGNAGVHIPHANAYPIAGRVRDFRPDGYPQDEPIVPHGMAVSLTAPEAFRFTFDAAPERHLTRRPAAGPDRVRRRPGHAAAVLATLMRDIGIPNGLAEVGYGDADVDDLVEGALQQQRLLATAPREVTGDDLAGGVPGLDGALVSRRPRTCVAALRRRGRRRRVDDVDARPGDCTPPTPRSTASSRRWWCGRGTPTRSPRCSTVARPPGCR